MRGDLERHLQGNVATGMNVRGDVNVHANIQIRELSIDQWADAPRSNTRREGARGNGYPVSNFQGGVIVVDVGTVVPQLLIRVRLTSMTATSRTTSLLALSASETSFSARTS